MKISIHLKKSYIKQLRQKINSLLQTSIFNNYCYETAFPPPHWSLFTCCLVSKASVDRHPPGWAHCPPRPCFCLQFHRDHAPLLSLQLALSSTRLFLPQSLGICYFPTPQKTPCAKLSPLVLSPPPNLSLNMITSGTSLEVQWIRFHALSAGGPGSISGQVTRSCVL